MRLYNITTATALTAFFGFATCTGILGCSSTPTNSAYDASTNPAEAITQLEQAMNSGISANYDVLAESEFSKAQKELNTAKDQQASGAKQEKVLGTLASARSYLEKAKAKSAALQEKAQGIMEARTAAVNAGVRKFPSNAAALKKADDEMRDEVSTLEKGKLSPARWAELQNSYLNLELSATQNTKLGDAKAKIEGARKDGATKNTPNTLKQAEFDLQNAENVIATDRHNSEKSAPAVEKANQSAQLLREVLATTKQPGGRVSEAVATNLVRQGHKIKDLDQIVSDKTESENDKDQQIAKQGQQIKDKDAALSLDQALSNARKEFKPEEADVYRQGDKLLIRLKNVNFASGRSDLPAASLALLSKVKDIAQELKPQQVVIEGHTDSVGTAEKNLSLSQSRADAVATYFASNGFEKDKVEAVGYGFKKPLVSNKTKAGRATNRRVDVIITPGKASTGSESAKSL